MEIKLALGVSEQAAKEHAPAFIWLLRAGDGRIMGGERHTGEKTKSVYAISGRYRVVVCASEDLGAMVGIVDAEDKKVAEGSFEVRGWGKMVLDKATAAVSFEGAKGADAPKQ